MLGFPEWTSGFSINYADAPGTTKSMRVAVSDLGLDHLWVIYAGSERYALDANITAIPAQEISELIKTLE